MKVCPSCKGRTYDENMKFCQNAACRLFQIRLQLQMSSQNVMYSKPKSLRNPGTQISLSRYGDYLVSLGLIDDALIQYFKAIEMKAGDEIVRMRIADAYRSGKQ